MSPWVSPHTFRLWIGIVGATIRCSLYLWTVYQRSLKTCPYFHITAFLITVLPECRSCPGVSPQRYFARSLKEVIAKTYPTQTVIQLSIGKTKKPIHRDIKNLREFCSRFKMMKLCIGFEIQIRGVCLLTNHVGRHCAIGWCGIVRLPLALSHLEFHFIFSYGVTVKLPRVLLYWRNVCLSMLLRNFLNIFLVNREYYITS